MAFNPNQLVEPLLWCCLVPLRILSEFHGIISASHCIVSIVILDLVVHNELWPRDLGLTLHIALRSGTFGTLASSVSVHGFSSELKLHRAGWSSECNSNSTGQLHHILEPLKLEQLHHHGGRSVHGLQQGAHAPPPHSHMSESHHPRPAHSHL